MSEQQNLPEHVKDGNVDQLPGYYDRWRERIYNMIAEHAPSQLADAVLLVPDMFALVVRLMMDERVPLRFRSQLFVVALYALMPVDLIPEVAFGALGLADDAVVMSAVILSLLSEATKIDPALIREHWRGKGDIMQVAKQVVDNKGEVVNTKIWKQVRAFFGDNAPDPAVVNGKKK